MANVVSDWRQALVTALATSFPNAEVKSGQRQGVSRDKDRINVFFGGWNRSQDRAVLAQPTMIVRAWKSDSKIPDSAWPNDPTELEQLSIDLLAALRAIQALPTLTRPWFFNVDSVTIDEDPEEWGVEARLVAWTQNLATVA
jgi:hypothetical protein